MANEYIIGTTVTLKVELYDDQDPPGLVDPQTLILVIAEGKKSFVTKQYNNAVQELRRISKGIYEYDHTTRVAATHTATFIAEGVNKNKDVEAIQFSVTGTNVRVRQELSKLG